MINKPCKFSSYNKIYWAFIWIQNDYHEKLKERLFVLHQSSTIQADAAFEEGRRRAISLSGRCRRTTIDMFMLNEPSSTTAIFWIDQIRLLCEPEGIVCSSKSGLDKCWMWFAEANRDGEMRRVDWCIANWTKMPPGLKICC